MKIRKETLWKLAYVPVWLGIAYLAGALLAQGFLDHLTRVGIGG